MRIAVTIMALLAMTACAPRQFSLLRQDGRTFLLPPGMRKAPPADGVEADCRIGTPVTPRASHASVYGCYAQTGFVDLQPGMRLKIVKPVIATGEPLKTEVLAQQGLNLTVRTNVTGVNVQMVEATQLGFAPAITHYRLFFLARDLNGGRKITLIGAPSAAALDSATQALEEYCAQPAAPCLAVTDGMVIGAQVPVSVQGKQQFFPLGASMREALPPEADPASIQLTRVWKGRAARVRVAPADAPQLFGVALNGGDEISYRMRTR